MAYKYSSLMFRRMPDALRAEDGWFRRGVRALAANRERLDDLEEALYVMGRNPGALRPEYSKELAEALGPSWDPADIGDLVQATVTLELAIHEFADDDPEGWVADLVGLRFLDEPDAKGVVEVLTAIHARNHVRRRTDDGVLPAFRSMGYTTEIRGGMHEGRRLRLTGICSIALHLDAEAPTTYFQLNRDQLAELIADLERAGNELDALERSLAGES